MQDAGTVWQVPTEPRAIDQPPPAPQPRGFDQDGDASRRTWLASERTVLAWLRTGLTATAVALAVGKVVPDLRDGGAAWPFVALGPGDGIVGLATVARAPTIRIAHGSSPSAPTVMWRVPGGQCR